MSAGGPRVAGLSAGEEGPQIDNGIAGTMTLDPDPRGIAGTMLVDSEPRGATGAGSADAVLSPPRNIAATGTMDALLLPDIGSAGVAAATAPVGPLPAGETAAAAAVDAVFASAVDGVAAGVVNADVSANASDPIGARNNLELARQMWRENPNDPDANARLEAALADVALAGKAPVTDAHADNMTELARQMRQDAADAQRRADAGEIPQEEADRARDDAEEVTVQAYELRMGIEHDEAPAQKQEPETGNDGGVSAAQREPTPEGASADGGTVESVVAEAGGNTDAFGGEYGGYEGGLELAGGDFPDFSGGGGGGISGPYAVIART